MSRGKNIRSWLASPSDLLAGGDVCALHRTAMSTGTARIHASFFIIPPGLSLSELLLSDLLTAKLRSLRNASSVNGYGTRALHARANRDPVARAEHCNPPEPQVGRCPLVTCQRLYFVVESA